MRDFGTLKGADLIPLLTTLLQEGSLASESEVQALTCVRKSNGAQTVLYFSSDYLIRAKSYQLTPALEDIFYAKRLIERAQKDKLETLGRESKSFSPGQYVLEQGWISQSEVAQVIANLIEMAAYEVLQWDVVQLHLAPASAFPLKHISNIPDRELLSVSHFISDADKNLPVLKLMKQELESFEWTLKRLKEAQRGELSPQQAHIYKYINHQRTLHYILQISDLGYFETLAGAYQLIKWGYIGRGSGRSQSVKSISVPKEKRIRQTNVRPQPVLPAKSSKAVSSSKYKISRRRFLERGRGSDLFQVLHTLLSSGETEGQLIVESQTQPLRATFEVKDKYLFHASSSAANVRFGDILLKKKRVTSEGLKSALKIQKETPNQHLGEILVQEGQLESQEIPALVYHQMECVLYEVLSWVDVKFYFSSELQASGLQQEIKISARFSLESGRLVEENNASLLYEADKALPILLMIRERLPKLSAVPMQWTVNQSSLSDVQQEVLQWVDGVYTLQDILLASSAGYVETYTALYQMVSTHVIGFQPEPPAVTTRLPEPAKLAPKSPVPVVQKPVSVASESVSHPLITLLGTELVEELLEIPEHKHQSLRQLLISALGLMRH